MKTNIALTLFAAAALTFAACEEYSQECHSPAAAPKSEIGKKLVENGKRGFSSGGGSVTASLFVNPGALADATIVPLLTDCVKDQGGTMGITQWYIIQRDGAGGHVNLVHGKQANVVYADGHCGTVKKETAYQHGFDTYFDQNATTSANSPE